jgi:hypothetical protein
MLAVYYSGTLQRAYNDDQSITANGTKVLARYMTKRQRAVVTLYVFHCSTFYRLSPV